MAIKTGVTASFSPEATTIGSGTALLCNRMTLRISAPIHDVTPFNPTANAKVYVRGRYTINGTASGFLDKDAAQFVITAFATPDATPGTFVITVSEESGTDDQIFTFTGILENFSPSQEQGQPATWSATFRATGPFTSLSGA